MKKDVEAEYWPRLLKDKATEKALPISADWSRYMDEDEEEEAKAAGAGGGGFDMSQFGGGAGGMVRSCVPGLRRPSSFALTALRQPTLTTELRRHDGRRWWCRWHARHVCTDGRCRRCWRHA